METLKLLLTLLVPLIGGGACGAVINEWFHRRRSRTQPIPLIERVNRLVSSELQGFVLARPAGEGQNRNLEAIQRVREYQLTLRNTSYIHIHSAEIQFEFPSEDVEAWAERPARSKTAPIPLEASISEPWKKGYRWLIPEFPPGDSMEFTFKAVDPPSDEYEVALYGGGQVVIEKSKGEPVAKGPFLAKLADGTKIAASVILFFILPLAPASIMIATSPTGSKSTVVDWAGGSLNVESSSFQVNSSLFSRAGPWKLHYSILNTGSRKCFVKWENAHENPATVEPGGTILIPSEYTSKKPRLVSEGLLFGPDDPSNEAMVKIYVPGTP